MALKKFLLEFSVFRSCVMFWHRRRFTLQQQNNGAGGAMVDALYNKCLQMRRCAGSSPARCPNKHSRTMKYENYRLPGTELLEDHIDELHAVPQKEIDRNIHRIKDTINIFYKKKIKEIIAYPGPAVTLYKIIFAGKVNFSAIKEIEKDISMALGMRGVSIVNLPDTIGIEIANDEPSIVPLKSVLDDPSFRESGFELPIAIGSGVSQKAEVFDLAAAPHILVAGATMQGKTVCLNTMITSLIYLKHPSELKLVLIDPKMVEFTAYAKLYRHYLAVLPTSTGESCRVDNFVVHSEKQADEILRSLIMEMDNRYRLLESVSAHDIREYNDTIKEGACPDWLYPMPYIVAVVDEYSDLVASYSKKVPSSNTAGNIENSIISLAQKGVAVGIHLIIATQKPSANVITKRIKANFPTRIAFRTMSRADSMTILDTPGAEKLIGRGDMLYHNGSDIKRIQCAYISPWEIDRITEFIAGQKDPACRQYCLPIYSKDIAAADDIEDTIDINDLDPMFKEAAELVVRKHTGAVAILQRQLGVGYIRAGRIMAQLECAGIVGPKDGTKAQQVLIKDINRLHDLFSKLGI